MNLERRIAFSRIRGMNIKAAELLCEMCGGVDGFFELSGSELRQAVGGDKDFCSDQARAKLLADAKAELQFIESKHLHVLWMDDDDYPRRLRMCDDAPVLLYAVGNCNFNADHVVAVVGTRNATSYGIKMAHDIIAQLQESVDSILIVSGLAYGIDVAAHRSALELSIPTAAVVAHGLNTLYPADHRNVAANMIKNQGAIVTEYVSTARIHRGNFLARNRIVAGMSDAVIVVESDIKGGALATARMAEDYGRDVFAVPGRATDRYSRGCNALIAKNTARIITSADDIIDYMGWTTKAKPGTQASFDFAPLTPEMQNIINHLRRHPEHIASEIANSLGVPYPELSARLMEMELEDYITINPGGKISVNI